METQELIEWGVRSSLGIVIVGIAMRLGRERLSAKSRFNVWFVALALFAGLMFGMNLLPAWEILPRLSGWNEKTDFASAEAFDHSAQVVDLSPAMEGASGEVGGLTGANPGFSMWTWLWIAGGALWMGRLLLSYRRLRRIHQPVASDHPGIAFGEKLRNEIGLKSEVMLVEGEGLPMTWGIFRPAIFLPLTARDWTNEQLEVVLRHELAHLKRRDPLWLLISQVITAFAWFHPGFWWISRRLGIERERATDDLVLNQGIRPSSYANTILNLSIHPGIPAASPAVALCGLAAPKSRSEVGARVDRILDPKQNRRSGSAWFLSAMMALLVIGGGMTFVVSQESKLPSITVVIDAGHGAHDSGGKGFGLLEKDLTLDISKRVEKLLSDRGVANVMTRDDDRFLSLAKRMAIASRLDSAFMVSIHCNTNGSGEMEGIECYTGGLNDVVAGTSESLGKMVLKHTVDETRATNRGLITGKQFTLLRSKRIPVVMIECGFVTDELEAAKLSTKAYREKIATGITNGIVAFLETNPDIPIE